MCVIFFILDLEIEGGGEDAEGWAGERGRDEPFLNAIVEAVEALLLGEIFNVALDESIVVGFAFPTQAVNVIVVVEI